MNLVEALTREHSKAQCLKIVRFVGDNPRRFERLLRVFLEGPYRITQRAAWPLNYCVEAHPALIQPHLKKILLNVKKPGLPDAVKRNTLRLLQFVDIPPSLRGLVVVICFDFFQSKKEPVAVKVFSMTVLANVAQDLKELRQELILRIEDQLPYGSAGFLSRAGRVLKQLKA